MKKQEKAAKGKKGIVVWASVSSALVVILLVVTILAQFVMVDLIGSVLGRDTAVFKAGVEPVFESEYTSKEQVLADANALNQEVCEEGFVLLKNEQTNGKAALPLQRNAKISVFGKNSVDLSYGGSGSSAAGDTPVTDLYASLEMADFEVNPDLKAFYESDSRSGSGRTENSSDLDTGDSVFYNTGETPVSKYDSAVKNSFAQYKDAALVVFTRIGGEGFDLPR